MLYEVITYRTKNIKHLNHSGVFFYSDRVLSEFSIFVEKLYMYKIIIALLVSFYTFAQENEVKLAQEFQEHLNEEFKDSVSSPLEKEDLAHFTSLDFYPISEKFIVKATS